MPENTEDLPKTPKEARELGYKTYYPGTPCPRGHISVRYVSCGACLECREDPHIRAKRAKWFRDYVKTPRGRIYKRAHNISNSRRNRRATPPWADKAEISVFSTSCPAGFHLDHIIPLKGENVCGLHDISNLQYLPVEENLSKSNKVDPLSLEAVICILPTYRSYVKTTT